MCTNVPSGRLQWLVYEHCSRSTQAQCSLQSGIAEEFKVSSLHMTFNTRDEWEQLGEHGFLRRNGIQYHWHNSAVTFPVNSAAESPGFSPYESFDDFLLNLKQSKRKAIRQVPARAVTSCGELLGSLLALGIVWCLASLCAVPMPQSQCISSAYGSSIAFGNNCLCFILSPLL